MDLTDKSQLIKYLKQHKLWAKKGLSQNFLVDQEALSKIVKAADLKTSDLVIEVGAGTGVLTQELVRLADKTIAIEFDSKLAELLKQQNCHSEANAEESQRSFADAQDDKEDAQDDHKSRLKIINSDILKLNLNEIIGNKPYKVVANIPYHITSKILELFLSRENKPGLMVLLVQKEVAERICASPRPENGRGKPGNMSILAISVQLYGRPEIIDVVQKESFFPSPKVDSAILKIVICNQLSVISKEEERNFFRLIHIGFAARRKTLVNNLIAGYHFERDKVIDIIKNMGLNDTVRAQELNIEQWKNLLGALENVS